MHRLPHPVALALIEIRKGLSLDPGARRPAGEAVGALSQKPQDFDASTAIYLNLRGIASLLRRGREGAVEEAQARMWDLALALEDVSGARLIFEFLADRGSAAGAYHLAQTYDPQIVAVSPLGSGPRPDAELARNWYLKAAELGHPEARKKIAGGN